MAGRPAPDGTAYRADIDGLRAVSILFVVAFHAGVPGFRGGYVGVDVFFVISGYLITGLLLAEQRRRGRVSLAEFFARRIRRLLPLSSLVISVTLVAGMALLPPVQREGLVHDARAAALYVANWRYAGQAVAYADAEVTDSFLTHYWSLSIEEQYYLLWPLLIVAVAGIARRRSGTLLSSLTVAIGIVVAASVAASILLTERLGPEAYYVTYTRLWAIGLGAAAAVVMPRVRPIVARLRPILAESAAVAGLLAIAMSTFAFDGETTYPGSAALLPTLGCLTLLVTGGARRTATAELLSGGPLPLIGRLSYAWYLWHWPALGVGRLLNARAGDPWPREFEVATAVAAALALAVVSHVLVERPIRLAAGLQSRPRRSLVLGAGLMIAPLLVGSVGIRVVDDGSRARADAPNAMSPAEAVADKVDIAGAEGCHNSFEGTVVKHDCVVGDPGADLTVALVGDSHAQQWIPALDRAGAEHGWKVVVWTKSSCPPIDVRVWNMRLDRRYGECDEWQANLAEELKSRGRVDAVVLANASSYGSIVLGPDGERVGDEGALRSEWSKAAERTFVRLLEQSEIVVRLHDTPAAPHDVPTCLSEHEDAAACAFGLAGAAALDRVLLDAESAAVATLGVSERVRFVDMTRAVCPRDPCEVVTDDGTIVYRDFQHLTQRFSLALADELGDRLDAEMGVN